LAERFPAMIEMSRFAGGSRERLTDAVTTRCNSGETSMWRGRPLTDRCPALDGASYFVTGRTRSGCAERTIFLGSSRAPHLQAGVIKARDSFATPTRNCGPIPAVLAVYTQYLRAATPRYLISCATRYGTNAISKSSNRTTNGRRNRATKAHSEVGRRDERRSAEPSHAALPP
jgi:hypothetical protein